MKFPGFSLRLPAPRSARPQRGTDPASRTDDDARSRAPAECASRHPSPPAAPSRAEQACDAATAFLATASDVPALPASHAPYRYRQHDPAALATLIARLCPDEAPAATGHGNEPRRDATASHGLPAGLSELDDVPGAALAAKPAYAEIITHGGQRSQDDEARVHHFQGHELSSTGADLGANLILGAALGVGGAAALQSGLHDIRQAGKRKEQLLMKKTALREKRQAFLDTLQAEASPDDEAQENPSLQCLHTLLRREVSVLDAELHRIDQTEGLNRHQRDVGAGSAGAGFLSLVRAIIDTTVKPVAYFRPETAEVTGALLSSVAVGLGPLAALAGLTMGVKAKCLSQTQRKALLAKLALAMEELGVVEQALPQDVREHYRRCFIDGKWQQRRQQTLSFDRLISYFVGGMAGYTGTMTGLSVAKIVALLAVGAIAADVTLSTAVLASALVVLVGVYGFMKYHSTQHEAQTWADSVDPAIDRDFFLSLAASGTIDALVQPLKLSMLVEQSRVRREDLLATLAEKENLRPSGLRAHSTDSEEIRARRERQRPLAGANAAQRFLANHQLTPRHLRAVTTATASLMAKSVTLGPGAAREHARATLAGGTDLLTARSLETVLASPRHGTTLADYMLGELEMEMRYLDDQLFQKHKLYGLLELPQQPGPDGMTGAAGTTAAADTDAGAGQAEQSMPQAPGTGWRHRLSRFRAAGQKISGATAASATAGSARHAREQHVREHFHGIGQRLLQDRQRLAEMQDLHTSLRQWKTAPSPDHGQMAAFQARYLALQRHQTYGGPVAGEAGKKTSARLWAEDLLEHARQRERATLGRLQVFTLDSTALRQTAASLCLPELDLKAPEWDSYLTAMVPR